MNIFNQPYVCPIGDITRFLAIYTGYWLVRIHVSRRVQLDTVGIAIPEERLEDKKRLNIP